MLFVATLRAFRNLLLPGIMKIFLWCLLAYAVAFGALTWLMIWLVERFTSLPNMEGFWASLLTGAGGMLLAWFMFPLLYPVLVSFFDEQVAEIIDREDYADQPQAVAPFWPTLGNDILFTLKALALNIAILPLLIITPVWVVVYYGMNGYLLGTQFFRVAAGRRVSRPEADQLQKNNFTSILLTGMTISFLATIPFINLAAPILGVAIMTHLFYLARAKAPRALEGHQG